MNKLFWKTYIELIEIKIGVDQMQLFFYHFT